MFFPKTYRWTSEDERIIKWPWLKNSFIFLEDTRGLNESTAVQRWLFITDKQNVSQLSDQANFQFALLCEKLVPAYQLVGR